MAPDEVTGTLERGREAGCAEALFCLGDKPEGVFPRYRAELASWGHGGTGRTPAQRDTKYGILRSFSRDEGEEPLEALDAVTDTDARLGSYAALTRDGRFRFQLKRAPRSA